MILEVATNGREVKLDWDTGSLEHILRANTTELQDVRGVDCTGRQNDLLVSIKCIDLSSRSIGGLNASRSKPAVEQDFVDLIIGQQLQVSATRSGQVVGVQRRRPSFRFRVQGRRGPVNAHCVSESMFLDEGDFHVRERVKERI